MGGSHCAQIYIAQGGAFLGTAGSTGPGTAKCGADPETFAPGLPGPPDTDLQPERGQWDYRVFDP